MVRLGPTVEVTLRLRPAAYASVRQEASRSGMPLEAVINDRLDPEEDHEPRVWMIGVWMFVTGALAGFLACSLIG